MKFVILDLKGVVLFVVVCFWMMLLYLGVDIVLNKCIIILYFVRLFFILLLFNYRKC